MSLSLLLLRNISCTKKFHTFTFMFHFLDNGNQWTTQPHISSYVNMNVSALAVWGGYLSGIHSDLVLNWDPLVWRELIDDDEQVWSLLIFHKQVMVCNLLVKIYQFLFWFLIFVMLIAVQQKTFVPDGPLYLCALDSCILRLHTIIFWYNIHIRYV